MTLGGFGGRTRGVRFPPGDGMQRRRKGMRNFHTNTKEVEKRGRLGGLFVKGADGVEPSVDFERLEKGQ